MDATKTGAHASPDAYRQHGWISRHAVERIVDKRRNKKGKWEYLIRWKGYGSKEDTWEPEHHLLHCEEFIEQFNSLGLHKAKFPKSRQESLIPRYPTAAETSRARSESRKKKRTCDPAVGVRAGDVLGMGSGGSGPMQKQRKVGHQFLITDSKTESWSLSFTELQQGHIGCHWTGGTENWETWTRLDSSSKSEFFSPCYVGPLQGPQLPTTGGADLAGSALANGKLHLHSSIKRKLAEEKGYVFDKRLRHNVRQNESNCRFRDIVVRKEEGFTHVLLSTQTTENNALTPESPETTVLSHYAFHTSATEAKLGQTAKEL
ncbi:Chromodomain Y-like protein 2 [Takifugu flavidus]|uniref:Chromodomain Y-like protein 2 n=1 Tax=Takifugu flavidus TaxID=433684 RepID=A0A5C6NR58_9TELE|nr:Chromodomain Y-like protein 2 [Takifugu flavidus]